MNLGIIGFGGVSRAFIKLLIDKQNKFNEKIILKYIINSKGGLYNIKGINLNEVLQLIEERLELKESNDWISNLSIDDIIKNKDINYLVELTNTNIETGEPGLSHISKALDNGINVVTGNKGPILKSYDKLKDKADKNNLKLMIGCTTGGALPSVNGGLIECAGSDILEVQGILNGTTNYILTKMREEDTPYEKVLKDAQALGIAELDPKLDVEGYDTASKMLILAKVLFGINQDINNIKIDGITNINLEQIQKSKNNKTKLKLIGKIIKKNNEYKISVDIEEINKDHPLFFVDDKNKGILYKTDTLGDISIIGGASGTINAAASILRDLVNIY